MAEICETWVNCTGLHSLEDLPPLPQLESLSLEGCCGLEGNGGLAVLAGCPTLTSLDLSVCTGLRSLEGLAPLHAEFSQAGIAVRAVSTDSVAGLKETLSAVGAETAVPFPLVSDEPLAAFRAYGAVDPRTGEAWHGVFLIDEQGRILWRDVGAEPFMALPELLAEAKRTLPLHASHPHAADGKTAATP